MELIPLGIGLFIGGVVSSFTILPILIIFRFAIPTVKVFEKHDWLVKGNGIVKKYLMSTVFLATVYIASYLLTQKFSTNLNNGFVVSSILTLVFGIGRTGENRDNLTDFLSTNHDKLTERGKSSLNWKG